MPAPRNAFSILAAALFVLALISYLVWQERQTERPEQIEITTAGFLEMCLSCHKDEQPDPDDVGDLLAEILPVAIKECRQ